MKSKFISEGEPLSIGVKNWEWDGSDHKTVSIYTKTQTTPIMQQLPGQEVILEMDTIYSVTLDADGKAGIIDNVETLAGAGLRRGININDIGTVLNVDYSHRHRVIFEPPIPLGVLAGSEEQLPTHRERFMKILPLNPLLPDQGK